MHTIVVRERDTWDMAPRRTVHSLTCDLGHASQRVEHSTNVHDAPHGVGALWDGDGAALISSAVAAGGGVTKNDAEG